MCSRSSLYSRLPEFPYPRLHPQAGNKQPTKPKSHWRQYKQPSPARHSGTFYARPPRPLLRNHLTTEHSRSISTVRGPLSVSYKRERVSVKGKKRELRSRIRVPTRQGPGPYTQPQSLWSPKPQIPRLPWATWAELAPRSPEPATPHSQPRYSVTSTITLPEPPSPSLRLRASLIRYAHAHAQQVAVDANAGCALSRIPRPRPAIAPFRPRLLPPNTASWHRTTGPSRQHSLPSPPQPPPPHHHHHHHNHNHSHNHHPRSRNSSDNLPQPYLRPRPQIPAPAIPITQPSSGLATNRLPRLPLQPLADQLANIPQPKSLALASPRRCLRRSSLPASLRSRRSDAVRRRTRGATRPASARIRTTGL